MFPFIILNQMEFVYWKHFVYKLNLISSLFSFIFFTLFFRDLRRADVIQRAHYMAYNKCDKIRVNKHTFSSLIYMQLHKCFPHAASLTKSRNRKAKAKKSKTTFLFSIFRNAARKTSVAKKDVNKFRLMHDVRSNIAKSMLIARLSWIQCAKYVVPTDFSIITRQSLVSYTFHFSFFCKRVRS